MSLLIYTLATCCRRPEGVRGYPDRWVRGQVKAPVPGQEQHQDQGHKVIKLKKVINELNKKKVNGGNNESGEECSEEEDEGMDADIGGIYLF